MKLIKDPALSERLGWILKTQLKVGSLGFGGPLATIAMMRSEFVDRHRKISPERFLEGLGIVKLLPGPVSTLMAIFLGHELSGFWGGLLSGICFILPAILMILGLAYAESFLDPHFKEAFVFSHTMSWIQAAILAIIFYTCWKLFSEAQHRIYAGKKRLWSVRLFAVLAAALVLLQVPELLILLLLSFMGVLLLQTPNRLRVSELAIFWLFFVAGSTVFGTGYMVLPYLQRILVEQNSWITQKEFLDAVVYGNLTPGPIVVASTYMGYKISGLGGALAASVGIFAAPFVLMLGLGPVFKKLLGKPWIEGVLLGLLPAVAACIAMSMIPLIKGIYLSLGSLLMLPLAFYLNLRRWPSWKILVLALALGSISSIVHNGLS